MAQLEVGTKIRTVSGQELTVLGILGEGGQGTAYKVELAGGEYALKWYHKSYLDAIDKAAFRENLAVNIKKLSPAAQFLWPKVLTDEVDGTFGYVMDLYPDGYVALEDFYWGKVYFPSWLSMIGVAMNIVDAFRILHSKGCSYQDLNFGGFRVKAGGSGTDTVRICDNDNVAPDGSNLGIRGFRGFMAPEVTTGKSLPNTETDQYSLAVLLFGIFFRGHPLEGRLTVEKAVLSTEGVDRIFYGDKALFCFDPGDNRNRPDPEVHGEGVLAYWDTFPAEFRMNFIRAFTVGLHDPRKRLLESEWIKALIELRNRWVYVPVGGGYQERFVKLDEAMPEGSTRIRIGKQVVAVSNGSRLLECHTGTDVSDFRTVTAKVAPHKKETPENLVMQNATQRSWYYTIPGREQVRVDPNGIIPLMPGVKISFAGPVGEVF